MLQGSAHNRQTSLCTTVPADAMTDCRGGKAEPEISYHFKIKRTAIGDATFWML